MATVLSFAVSACGSGQEIDCREVHKNLDDCLKEAGVYENMRKISECIPHSDPMIIAGRYASAFEFNQFYEGPFANQENPWEFSWNRTSLDFDREPFENEKGEPVGTVSEITFVGRKPLCRMVPNEEWLLVDRVIKEKVISTVPFNQ